MRPELSGAKTAIVKNNDEPDIAYAFDTKEVAAEKFRLAVMADNSRDLITEWLTMSGVGSGWRVLEVGCGTGAVTTVVADLVGPTGTVVAIDRDDNMVETARQSLASRANVTVESGDFTDLAYADGTFDAVVGRLTLMYQPDLLAAVLGVARVVRSGGVVAFMEADNPAIGERQRGYETGRWPVTELTAKVTHWSMTGIMVNGTHPHMGLRLPSLYAEAGLVPGDRIVSRAIILNQDPRWWPQSDRCSRLWWRTGSRQLRKSTSTRSRTGCRRSGPPTASQIREPSSVATPSSREAA